MRRRVIELREGRIIRDELSGLYRPDESTTEFADPPARRAGRRRRGPPELDALRLLPQGGPPRPLAQLGAGAGRAAHRPAHGARARRVHPDRAGHHRHRQRGPQPRGGRRLREGRRHRRRAAELQHGDRGHRQRQVGRVHLQGRGPAHARRRRTREAFEEGAELLGANPLPDTFRVTPEDPDRLDAIVDRLAPETPTAREPSLAAIDEVRNSEEDTDKILSATGLVKILTAGLAVLLCSPRSR